MLEQVYAIYHVASIVATREVVATADLPAGPILIKNPDTKKTYITVDSPESAVSTCLLRLQSSCSAVRINSAQWLLAFAKKVALA
jgi:hypothetical protein